MRKLRRSRAGGALDEARDDRQPVGGLLVEQRPGVPVIAPEDELLAAGEVFEAETAASWVIFIYGLNLTIPLWPVFMAH